VRARLANAPLGRSFSSGGTSSLSAGKVLCLEGPPASGLCCISTGGFEEVGGTAWRVKMDEQMVPVAAMKPSGGLDTSKLAETRRSRPLSDDEAVGRFSTREEEAVLLLRGDASSMGGNGSVSISVP